MTITQYCARQSAALAHMECSEGPDEVETRDVPELTLEQVKAIVARCTYLTPHANRASTAQNEMARAA